MRHLDLENLRALVAIVDHGGFSAAAAQLGRTQSAISLQLKRLEQGLGQTLLDRVQGRVGTPTAEGVALLSYARQILRLHDEACAALQADSAVGSLRLGVPEELMEAAFPVALARLRARFPRIRISVRVDTAAGLRAALAEAALEAVIYKDCSAHWPANARSLREEPLCWVVAEAYRDTLLLEDGALPVAVLGENCVFRTTALQALAAAGTPVRIQFSGSGPGGLCQALLHGLGVGVLPRSLLRPGLIAVASAAGLALPHLPTTRLLAEWHPDSASAQAWVEIMADYLHASQA